MILALQLIPAFLVVFGLPLAFTVHALIRGVAIPERRRRFKRAANRAASAGSGV